MTYRPGNSRSWEAFEQDDVRTYSELDDERSSVTTKTPPFVARSFVTLAEYGGYRIESRPQLRSTMKRFDSRGCTQRTFRRHCRKPSASTTSASARPDGRS